MAYRRQVLSPENVRIQRMMLLVRALSKSYIDMQQELSTNKAQRTAAWDKLMGPNTLVLAAHKRINTQIFQKRLQALMRKKQGSRWQLCKWVAACLPGQVFISQSLLAQATGRSENEADYLLKWEPRFVWLLPEKHDFAIWGADGMNEIVYKQIERELTEMGILDLCGFANPLHDPVKTARLLSEETETCEQLHPSKQPSSSAVLAKPVPARITREPSFASWDDMKIPAIRTYTGAGVIQGNSDQVYTRPVDFKQPALMKALMSDCTDATSQSSQWTGTTAQQSVASHQDVQSIASPLVTTQDTGNSKFDIGAAPVAAGNAMARPGSVQFDNPVFHSSFQPDSAAHSGLETEPNLASLGMEQEHFRNPLYEEGQGAELPAVSGLSPNQMAEMPDASAAKPEQTASNPKHTQQSWSSLNQKTKMPDASAAEPERTASNPKHTRQSWRWSHTLFFVALLVLLGCGCFVFRGGLNLHNHASQSQASHPPTDILNASACLQSNSSGYANSPSIHSASLTSDASLDSLWLEPALDNNKFSADVDESSGGKGARLTAPSAEAAMSQSLQAPRDSAGDSPTTNMPPSPMLKSQPITTASSTSINTPSPDTPTPMPTPILGHPITHSQLDSPLDIPTLDTPTPTVATVSNLPITHSPSDISGVALQPACAAESDTSAGDSDGLLVCSATPQPLWWNGVQSPAAAPKSSASLAAVDRDQAASMHSPVAQQSMTGVTEQERFTSAVVPVSGSALQTDNAQATDQGQRTTALAPVLESALQLGSAPAAVQHTVDSTMLAAYVSSLFSSSHRWALAQHSALANGPQLSSALMVYADSASIDTATLSVSTISQLEIRSRDNMAAVASSLYSNIGWRQACRHAVASGPQLTMALALHADFIGTGWDLGSRACGAVNDVGEPTRSQVPAVCYGRGRHDEAGSPAGTERTLSSYSSNVIQGLIARNRKAVSGMPSACDSNSATMVAVWHGTTFPMRSSSADANPPSLASVAKLKLVPMPSWFLSQAFFAPLHRHPAAMDSFVDQAPHLQTAEDIHMSGVCQDQKLVLRPKSAVATIPPLHAMNSFGVSSTTALILHTSTFVMQLTPTTLKAETASDLKALPDRQPLPYLSLPSYPMPPCVFTLAVHSPLSCTTMAVYVSSSTPLATAAVATPTTAVAGLTVRPNVHILRQPVMLAALAATSTSPATITAVALREDSTDPAMYSSPDHSRILPLEPWLSVHTSLPSTARLDALSQPQTASALQLYITPITCQVRAVSADSNQDGVPVHTPAFVHGQQLFGPAAAGSGEHVHQHLLVQSFTLLPCRALCQVLHTINYNHSTVATPPPPPTEEMELQVHVKAMMQVDEPNVDKSSTRAVLTTEAGTAADVGPLLMPHQHHQEGPALAVVLQRLDNMQAQMHALQHSIVEAMAEAAYWRSTYAEAVGLTSLV